MPSALILSKGNESRKKDSSSTKCCLPGGRMSGRGQGNFLSLKADELQVGQRQEYMERKREYYHIIIFPERILNFTSRKERKSEHHSDGIFQQPSLSQVRTC